MVILFVLAGDALLRVEGLDVRELWKEKCVMWVCKNMYSVLHV